MKYKILLFAALLFASFCQAQRINPATQIKKAPAQNYVLLSDSNFDYQPTLATALNALLADEIVQAAGAPSGAPSGTQGNGYINTTTGTFYAWNGSAWISQGDLNAFGNGLTKTGTAVALGGNLTGNTTLNGQSLHSVNMSNLLDFIVTTDNSAATAKSVLNLSIALSQAAYLRVEDKNTATTFGELRVDADGTETSLKQKSASGESGVYMPSVSEARIQAGTRAVKTTSTDIFLENISAAGGSETEVVYINPSTGKIGRGAAPSGGSGVTVGDKQDIDVVSTNVWVIDTGAVNTLKLAANAVDSTRLAANAVRTSDIGDAQVTMAKIAQATATSGQVIKWNGSAWAPAADATGGSSIVNATPATGVFTTATGAGVTASRSAGTVTITVPTGVQLLSARVTGADADNSVGGDLTVVFTGAGIIGNTSVATLHIPATQKIDLSAQLFGAPGTGNPFGVDDDDTVQMQVIGVGSGGSPSITMRAVGLTSNYDNYQLIYNF